MSANFGEIRHKLNQARVLNMVLFTPGIGYCEEDIACLSAMINDRIEEAMALLEEARKETQAEPAEKPEGEQP